MVVEAVMEGKVVRMRETMESSFDWVREARMRRAGDWEDRERVMPWPRELGDTPVTTTSRDLLSSLLMKLNIQLNQRTYKPSL